MKTFNLLATGLIAGSMILSSCGKDDDNTQQDPTSNKTTEEKFQDANANIRKAKDLLSGASSDMSDQAQSMRVSEEFDYCSLIESMNDQANGSTCETITMECVNDGADIQYTIDYGQGCDVEGQTISGKMLFTMPNFADPANATDFNNFTLSFEYQNLSFNDDESISGTGTQTTSFDMTTFESSSTTTGSYTIKEGTETMTLDFTDESSFETDGTITSVSSISGTSDAGYSITVDTDQNDPVTYSTSCNLSDDYVNYLYPISGTQNATLTEGGNTETFTYDYGDGTCDFIYDLIDSDGNSQSYHIFTDELMN